MLALMVLQIRVGEHDMINVAWIRHKCFYWILQMLR